MCCALVVVKDFILYQYIQKEIFVTIRCTIRAVCHLWAANRILHLFGIREAIYTDKISSCSRLFMAIR
jgi:hypothetical protein